MDRLTHMEKLPSGCRSVSCECSLELCSKHDGCQWCPRFGEIMFRLAEYEETDMTPEQVAAMKNELADMKELWDVLPVHIQAQAIQVRDFMKEQGKLAKGTNVPTKTATDTNVGGRKSLLFSKRLLLAQMSEEWNRQNGVRECALSTITYLHAHDLIDVEKELAFLESAEKDNKDLGGLKCLPPAVKEVHLLGKWNVDKETNVPDKKED